MAKKSHEDPVLTCPNIETANQVRHWLVEEFSGCWFYVYTETCQISVSNDFGGCLREDRVTAVCARAAEMLDDLSKSQPQPEIDIDLDETEIVGEETTEFALPVQTF